MDFSREVIALSGSVRAEAWALRRLAEKYAGATAGSLDANSRQLLNEMIRDHLRALANQTDQARRLIEPPLHDLAPAGAAEGSDLVGLEAGRRIEWADQALALSSLCDRADRWIAVVFAGVNLPSVTAEEAVGKLLQALPILQREIAALNQELGRATADRMSHAVQHR